MFIFCGIFLIKDIDQFIYLFWFILLCVYGHKDLFRWQSICMKCTIPKCKYFCVFYPFLYKWMFAFLILCLVLCTFLYGFNPANKLCEWMLVKLFSVCAVWATLFSTVTVVSVYTGFLLWKKPVLRSKPNKNSECKLFLSCIFCSVNI